MLCFKFLKSSGFTEKLKPLGILVPIRKPERGKTSHKHYILGLKFKKLDALTSKKTVFFVNRGLSFKLRTGSLHSSVLLSTVFTLNWNFDTFFWKSKSFDLYNFWIMQRLLQELCQSPQQSLFRPWWSSQLFDWTPERRESFLGDG